MHRDVIIAFSNHLLIKVADIFVKGRKKFLDTLQTMPEEARSRIPQEMSGPSQHVSAHVFCVSNYQNFCSQHLQRMARSNVADIIGSTALRHG